MFLKNVRYLLSAPDKAHWLDGDRKELAIVGRSNVGKSTFINKITNNNSMAKVSKTPGYTKYLNFFDVNGSFYLVDTPGYGFAKASWTRDESFANMMSEYLYQRENLLGIILIVDAYVGITKDDKLLLDMAKDANRKVYVIASKTDKCNQSERSKFLKNAKEILDEEQMSCLVMYSSLNNKSIDKVCDLILDIYNK